MAVSYIDKPVNIVSGTAAMQVARSASQLAADAVEQLGNIPQYVKTGEDGLTITDGGSSSVMRVTSSSVSIGTVQEGAAEGFSQFAANYVMFGDYMIRRSADGGLAFRRV